MEPAKYKNMRDLAKWSDEEKAEQIKVRQRLITEMVGHMVPAMLRNEINQIQSTKKR